MKVTTSRIDSYYEISIELGRGMNFGLRTRIDTRTRQHATGVEVIMTTESLEVFLAAINEIFSYAEFAIN